MDTAFALTRFNRYQAEAQAGDPDLRLIDAGPLRYWLGTGTSAHENTAVYTGAPEHLAGAIEQALAFFAQEDRDFEFKLTAWNMPPETSTWLEAKGFIVGETEQVLAIEAGACILPAPREDMRLRELTSEADLQAIAGLQQAIWQTDFSWLTDGLWREKQADPKSLELYGIEEGEQLVSAAWMRMATDVAMFHGGATLPAWRGKGLYRELVHARLRRCRQLRLSWAFTEALPASLPILQKLGFDVIGETCPYYHTHSPASREVQR
jgi:GNAT superfamily N-acetyltransferase